MDPIERLRATYEFKPLDRLVRREFYIWDEAIERWKAEGMPTDVPRAELFGFDGPGSCGIGMLGWCEPEFIPPIEEAVLEETDEYQVIRDSAGRHLKVFKGRRHGFMPTYLKHAVTNDADWDRDVLPLLSPTTPARWQGQAIEAQAARLPVAAAEGRMITLGAIGGYMYLRALVGPEEICYMFIDNPGLIHKMMRAWLDLAEAVSDWAQRASGVGIDEVFLAEDICYNHGLLISPDMVREFLFPYYQQLVANIRSRQPGRRLHFQIDTDGNCHEAIDLYREIGMDVMSPFEVAAGNDVVAIGRKYPDLVMSGGIDKRVLAAGRDAIDEFLNRVIPPMVKRSGYIPTCDHGVPDNVSYADYMHYRRRIMELDH
jgi:uroporphyrinogen decarboxylase